MRQKRYGNSHGVGGIMLFLGVLLLILLTFIVWREYAYCQRLRLSQLSEFLSFIKNMKERMECYLEAPGAWINGYESQELERIGFIKNIRERKELLVAYESCKEGLLIDNEASCVIEALFSELGEGYLDSELEVIESALEKLSRIEASMASESEKKIKTAGALLGAVAAGIVILVI